MDNREINMQPEQQAVLNRFTQACQQDERILAAFLGGSYARRAADKYSDLDLYLITRDESFNDFIAGREPFMRRLGVPLFLENFGNPNIVFYIFEDGVEGELGIGQASQFETIHSGLYQVLLDRQGLLSGAIFHEIQPEEADQNEKLRRLLTWFWHEWLHFTTALGRGHLWWAQGQLEVLRGFCVSLARLRRDFSDHYALQEPYFKIEYAVPVEQLSSLTATFGPLEKKHLVKAGLLIVQVYRELGLPLAREHGIPYPEALERVMVKRVEEMA